MKRTTKNPMNRSIFFVLLAMAFGLQSCLDPVELDIPDSDPRLVVDGWIYDDMTIPSQVKLSLTSPYFSNAEAPAVSGAIVRLYEDGELIETLQESATENGIYPISNPGVLGKAYHIEVRTPEGQDYRSNPETISRISDITNIYYEYEEGDALTSEGYYVYIDTYEPAGKGDYYRWKYYVDGVYQNNRFDLAYAEDGLVDGNDIEEIDITDPIVFTTSEFAEFNESGLPVDKESGDLLFDDIVIDQDSVVIRVEQSSISKEAFDFFAILNEQTAFIGSIFDPPPAPIRGNVFSMSDSDDYALGYFGASAVSSAEVIVVDEFDMAGDN